MIELIDVSKWQDPERFDWPALVARGVKGVIARASYGAGTADPRFKRFAELTRQHSMVFGAYHFYRQIHSVEQQLALFDQQLETIGGLEPGDFFPVLDMEENQTNGDGRPNPKAWNRACDEMGDAWKNRFGGCILYYSSFFPDWLNAHKGDTGWHWMKEDGYCHWLADYNRSPGNPRTPYTATWHLHQPRPSKMAEYLGGQAAVDQDYVNPDVQLEDLRILTSVSTVGVDPEAERPGGAHPEDLIDGVAAAYQGAQMLADGLGRMEKALR